MLRRLFIVLIIFLAAHSTQAAELRVSAASSLTDALRELGPLYEQQSGDHLVFNFGASSTLARQIMEGAPADVFISADEAKMNQLDQGGYLERDTRRSILSNTLVIIVPSDSKFVLKGPADLASAKVKTLAVAEPQSVPAGIYARQYLRSVHLWDRLLPKIVPTENVRAALAAVEAGNAEAGIVYRTDALISRSVKIAIEIPAAEGPKISYPAAVVGESKVKEQAKQFVQFLQTDQAREVFRKYGFLLP